MVKICVFAGTTEGRLLTEFLSEQPAEVTACVATEYGETLLKEAPNVHVFAGRLDEVQMKDLFCREQFQLVVDATHPYAAVVTENIVYACEETKTPYFRLLRQETAAPGDAFFAETISDAVAYLNGVSGNILLTTGSKELQAFTGIQNFADRVYARVLPMEDSLRLCREAGVAPKHILAMQGPFCEEMNTAMLRSTDARFLVTKESGRSGGFEEKIRAARKAGASLVVIGRPPQRQGRDLEDTIRELCRDFGFSFRPEVTVVGIGPGSRNAMTEEVREAIEKADCLIGAGRMLENFQNQPSIAAIAPADIRDAVINHPQYRKFAVLMSGDVGFFSGTKKLLPMLPDCHVTVLPGLSSLSYLCSRLGTSYEDAVPVSLHGRDHDLVPDIRKYRKVFTLVGGENGMGKLCAHLTENGLGSVLVSVGERLSYPDEAITIGTARELSARTFAGLSVALIENENPDRVVTPGLPDSAFQRSQEGQKTVPMTKSEVRAICLSKLQLLRDSICWDVGAGTGSVSVEMALQANLGQVYAIERKPEAVKLLGENRSRFFAENLQIVSGIAPAACETLPAPSRVFIGGSTGNMEEILRLVLSRNPNARIVATAISLESVAELTRCIRMFPFRETEVVSVSVARDRKAGPYHLMTGQNPVYIFTMQAGEEKQ